MKRFLIAIVLVLTLIAGSIVVSDIRDKNEMETNAEEVAVLNTDKTREDTASDKIGTRTDTQKTETEAAKTTENKTDVEDADTEQTTNATTEATTERPATTTERPAATTEAPASNHTHNWVKVVDRAAYDEPIYTEKPVYEERPVYEEQVTYQSWDRWRDGTDASSLKSSIAKANWCAQHCTRCTPNCTDPDPRGYCAWYDILSGCDEIVTQVQTGTEKVQVGTEKIQTGTKHHDEEYHYECTCGARK